MDEQKQRASDTERIIRLETAVESIGKDVHRISTSIDNLVDSLGKLKNQQGRHDWRTMAAWAAVVVSLILPMVGFSIALGVREVAAIQDNQRRHEEMPWHRGTGERVSALEAAQSSNAVIVNMARDESARWDRLIGSKVGIEVPPPTYFVPSR